MERARIADIAARYDRLADRDAHKTHWLDSITFEVLSRVESGGSILEVGCGNGRAVPVFEQFNSVTEGEPLTYTGIDCSRKSIDVARKLYPTHTFIHGNAFDASSLFSEKFDCVWLGAVLMIYAPSEARALFVELRRVLHKGAMGFLSVPYGTGAYRPASMPPSVTYHQYHECSITEVFGSEFEVVTGHGIQGMMLLGFRAC